MPLKCAHATCSYQLSPSRTRTYSTRTHSGRSSSSRTKDRADTLIRTSEEGSSTSNDANLELQLHVPDQWHPSGIVDGVAWVDPVRGRRDANGGAANRRRRAAACMA